MYKSINPSIFYDGKEYVIWVPVKDYDSGIISYSKLLDLWGLDDAAKNVHPNNEVLKIHDENVRKQVFSRYKEAFVDSFTFTE